MPKWYFVDTTKLKKPTYTLHRDFGGFDHIDVLDSYTCSRFETIASPEGYRSIHYIINMQGNYVELQLR